MMLKIPRNIPQYRKNTQTPGLWSIKWEQELVPCPEPVLILLSRRKSFVYWEWARSNCALSKKWSDHFVWAEGSFCLEVKSSIKVVKKALIRGIGPRKTLEAVEIWWWIFDKIAQNRKIVLLWGLSFVLIQCTMYIHCT